MCRYPKCASHQVARNKTDIVLVISPSAAQFVRRIFLPSRWKNSRSPLPRSPGQILFARVLGEQKDVLKPLNSQSHRAKNRGQGLKSERFQGGLRVRRVGRNIRNSKLGDQGSLCFQASFLNVLVKFRLRPFGLAKLSPSCLQQEQYFSRCGKVESGKRGMSFDNHTRSRPLCLKTKFSTDVAGSLSVQEDAISKGGPLLPGIFRPNLVKGRPGSWRCALIIHGSRTLEPFFSFQTHPRLQLSRARSSP